MEKVIALFGKSGSGKTTVGDFLDQHTIYKKVLNTTTRLPRDGEVDGVDYHFVTVDRFLELSALDEFAERAKHGENYYGIQRDDIDTIQYGMMVLNVDGMRAVKEVYGDRIIAVYLRMGDDLRVARQLSRGDHPMDISNRMKVDEVAFANAIDYVDIIIDCDQLSVQDVVEEILSKSSLVAV